MAKKLVVRRDLRKRRKGGAPYLKYLVFAALALIFLIVVTPYLLKNKSRKVTEKRPLPDRGAVTKQLPKPTQQQPIPEEPMGSAAGTTTPGVAKATVPGTSSPPERSGSVKPTQAQVAPKPGEKAPAPAQEATPVQTQAGSPTALPEKQKTPEQPPAAAHKPLFPATPKVSTPTQPAQTVHTAPKDLFPEKAGSAHGPGAESRRAKGVKETAVRTHHAKRVFSAKPAPRPGVRHGAAHAFRPSVSDSYSVQVGSIFRTFGEAESLRKHLAAKGYTTSIHRVARLGYLVVTSPGPQSSAYTLLMQMNAEGVTNAKVVPVDSQAR